MSPLIMIYFTSSMLNMFRTLIHPSSGACDFSIVSPHRSCVLVSVCVGVSVWLGWGGIRVAGIITSAIKLVSFSSIIINPSAPEFLQADRTHFRFKSPLLKMLNVKVVKPKKKMTGNVLETYH